MVIGCGWCLWVGSGCNRSIWRSMHAFLFEPLYSGVWTEREVALQIHLLCFQCSNEEIAVMTLGIWIGRDNMIYCNWPNYTISAEVTPIFGGSESQCNPHMHCLSSQDGSHGAYPISCEEGENFIIILRRFLMNQTKPSDFYLVTFPLQVTTTIITSFLF